MKYINFKNKAYKFDKKFGISLPLPLSLHHRKKDSKNDELKICGYLCTRFLIYHLKFSIP
jgi:hypothetical protein